MRLTILGCALHRACRWLYYMRSQAFTNLFFVQVPLLLWVASVVVIFAVSQNSLKGLQVRLAV
jgi:hypothetical protein